MVTIVQSTAIVAGPGVEASTVQVQVGAAGNAGFVVQHGGILSSNIIDQFGGIEAANDILQFTGIAQDTHIVNPSQFETTAGTEFIIFPKDFSRSALIAGAIGTSGTIEHYFDRSPFFFTPSETDPNTLRDISEAEQFLIFSHANIFSFDPFRNTPKSTYIITDRGIEGTDLAEILTNGSFEQGVSGWTVSGTTGGNSVTVVDTRPAGAGFDDANPVSPTDGDYMAYIKSRRSTVPSFFISQEYNFGTRAVNSSQLETFGFSICPDYVYTSRYFQANLIFLLGGEQKANLRYRISGMGTPQQPPEVTQGPIDAYTITGVDRWVWNGVARNIKNDLHYTTFEFDQIQTYLIFGAIDFDCLLDGVGVTLDLPQSQLLKTSDLAHINTAHPIGTAQFGLETLPFTISGADDVTQVDLSGPFFAELDPASGTRNVPETTNLTFHIQDISSALDQGTINVFAEGLQIVSAGVTVTGTDYPVATKTVLAPNDIEYIFYPAAGVFAPGETVVVSGSFADFAAVSNYAEGNYDFAIVGSGTLGATISGAPDVTPPVITPTDPASSATQVSPNTDILFTLTDDASGVDPSTVKLLLNGATKIENDVATGGTFSRVANTSNGYDYAYNSDGQFTFGDTITGTVIAEDFAGNSDSVTYEFTVTPTDTLYIEDFFMTLDESIPLTPTTTGSVRVRDDVWGVASGTTYFTLNGVVPSGLVATYSGVAASGTGPASVLFEVPLEPLVDFRDDLVILVHAENEFPGSFPVIKEQQFTLRPGYDVDWPNKTEDAEGGPEVTFPYITNIQVLADVLNYAGCGGQGEASAFFRVLTEGQHQANLGATIVSNIKTADLPAVVESLNPFFEYGKTMILEIEADDLEGNQFRLTHTFVIEQRP